MTNQNNGPVYAGALVACVLIVTLGVLFSGMLKSGPAPQGGGVLSSVSVSASGTAKGLPSMATIDIFLNATGNTTAAATANLSARLGVFNTTVSKYVNGNMSLVKTNYYDVSKVYTNRTNATPVYQAVESATITLPELSKLNSFLANITNVPGLQVQGVSAELSDAQVSGFRQQALQAALTNATGQAISLIGNAAIVNTTISVNSYYAVPYPLYAANTGSGAIVKSPTPTRLYYNGTASVYESIQVTFYYRK